MAISGALALTCLGLTTINIYSQVGLITLVGFVAKNGILIVEFANHLQEHGHSKINAILEASKTRLRASSDYLGGNGPRPLSAGYRGGPGAMARNSIGIVLVAGMLIGTIFTLFVVPALYLIIAATHPAEEGKTEETPQEIANA